MNTNKIEIKEYIGTHIWTCFYIGIFVIVSILYVFDKDGYLMFKKGIDNMMPILILAILILINNHTESE